MLTYQVFYKLFNKSHDPAVLFNKASVFNTSLPFAKITSLEMDKVYQFFVVARNSLGSSLPSSVIMLNVSRSSWEGDQVKGAPSPPHQLRASWVSVSSIQVIRDHSNISSSSPS